MIVVVVIIVVVLVVLVVLVVFVVVVDVDVVVVVVLVLVLVLFLVLLMFVCVVVVVVVVCRSCCRCRRRRRWRRCHRHQSSSSLPSSSSSSAASSGRSIDLANSILKRRGVTLPRHLVVQTDNTCRESRNQFMMIAGAVLIAGGYFESVSFPFFRVGHTHFCVDQRFVCLGACLDKASILQTPEAERRQ